MQTVHLKGELGERFGEKWSMNVNKVQDIFRLIECQRQGFRPYIQECIENEIDFTVQRGKEFIDETELLLSLGKEDIIVTPIPAGSKGKAGKLLAAVLIIAGGWYLATHTTTSMAAGNVTFTAEGQMIRQAGTSATFGTAGKVAGYTMMALGTSLGLRTLAEMMDPDPSEPEDDSHLFSGPLNTTVQGGAVPILY